MPIGFKFQGFSLEPFTVGNGFRSSEDFASLDLGLLKATKVLLDARTLLPGLVAFLLADCVSLRLGLPPKIKILYMILNMFLISNRFFLNLYDYKLNN